MRRLLLLAPLLLCTVGCGVLQNSEDEATDAAREVARKAGERLHSRRPRTAQEVGRSTAGLDGVEVLGLSGKETHDGDGVDVVVRTSGSAYDGMFDVQQIVVQRCFSLHVSPTSEWGEDPDEVDCPDNPAMTFPPPPAPPELPYEELRTRLPRVPEGGRVDEAEVRRVLAALDMDPAIRSEVREDSGRIGIHLSLKSNGFDPQDCVLARVEPGETVVWTPPRIQRMPGEGGCSVGFALNPMPAPH
ncbi:translation initiation factor IF-2 [Streptomyces filamentosus]|uniref:translation initiation factor IF-2 n=1 Tax=Streptomyces filamentosus TaxID=67294 RepID=UPI0033DCCCB2